MNTIAATIEKLKRDTIVASDKLVWRAQFAAAIATLLDEACGIDPDLVLKAVLAALDEAECEGMDEAASVLDEVQAGDTHPERKRVLGIAAKSVRDLAERNRAIPEDQPHG